MTKRQIYRDYRAGKKGQFASEATFNRSTGQGVECHVHKETVDTGKIIDDVADLFDYEDYADEDLFDYEYHGTGDTGRASE